MKGQMCWLSKYGNDGEKILHLRLNNFEAWTPYTAMPKYSVPDYKDMPDGSKGWATFQKLLRDGWKIVASEPAYKTHSAIDFPPEQMAS
ncbi:MAG: hypothetical protein MUD14_01700 [Hydrococcus sp. Prado102]|jgi:hypothetical protein|nr:hypothetical protein [Hydrococcus sp. Prado102]